MSTEPHGHHDLTEVERVAALTALVKSADKETRISPAFDQGTSANNIVRKALDMDNSPANQKRATYILQRLILFGFIERVSRQEVRILPRAYAVLDQHNLGLSDYEEYTETMRLAEEKIRQLEGEIGEYRAENEALWRIIEDAGLEISPATVVHIKFRATARAVRQHHGPTA